MASACACIYSDCRLHRYRSLLIGAFYRGCLCPVLELEGELE